ncbi:major facilitator superfamily transporter [Pochonia chlamydosporia 170]|uniref:Major facilitator superfamily transporter n=1 Tax=Pochonia chlamydosporia 170 TaxID=1380566 RepID=A0A179FFF9_METCM|nr:major facilitator superfamily transporter [Pochonia chlamydosporia 170]OAQ64335.2 major facilitator superfamily transporter [Pochonia chlamydosporia 170]
MQSSMDAERSASRPLEPGTVQLEDLTFSQHGEIILQPAPSDDPNDPLNWSRIRKTVNFSLVCLYTVMVYTVIDISTVVYGQVHDELGFSFQELNQSFAASNAGLAIGGVLFVPFAFKFGRRPIYLISIVIMLGTTVWQACMQNRGDLYGFSVVSGLAGSIGETICAMTLADLFFVHQRGSLTNVLTIAINTGAYLGPVAAGYVAASQGWRWIWWWCSILLGVTLLLFVFCYEETIYIPEIQGTVIEGTADHGLDKDQIAIDSKAEASHLERRSIRSDIPIKSYKQRMSLFTTTDYGLGSVLRHTYQPFVVITTFPGVSFVALLYGSLLAWLAIVLSVQGIYFTLPPYSFSSSGVGLLNVPTFVGSLLGGFYGGQLSDYSIQWLARRNGGLYEPEMRLWLALPTILITPAGYFMFGLSMAEGMPWYIPAVGLGIYGFGSTALGNIALVYLVDSYRDVIGDAYIGITFLRNAFGTVAAMCLSPWVDSMGLYNMTS